MQQSRLNIAVFIDFDNIEIGVKSTLGERFDVGAVLEAVKERGEVVTKIAYGDWTRAGDYSRMLTQHAVRMVQRNLTPGGDKNGADINLALDALEMAFTHAHINAFVIVGGDSDFITLVEKLKQYDRKVFVVGGRSFTSQVMQKNCTEFIAYENVVPDRRGHRVDKGERPKSVAIGVQPIDGAVALVKRALKVLADREVTPQLGLLKSTLLQLDSSFSERDYGCSSFRDFADKLAAHGIVGLKHQGRSTLVELVDGPDGGRLGELLDRATGRFGLEVEAMLLQDPGWALDPAGATERVRRVVQYHAGRRARGQAGFAGLHFDIEPHSEATWACATPAEREATLRSLHEVFRRARVAVREGAAAPTPLLTAALPWWLGHLSVEVPAAAPAEWLRELDEVVLMVYGDPGGPLVGESVPAVVRRIDDPRLWRDVPAGRGIRIGLATFEHKDLGALRQTIAGVEGAFGARPGFRGVAIFANEAGLEEEGNNYFLTTANTGQRILGRGASSGAGEIVGGALEGSNVDTALEFVHLIEAQRGFQANARVITVQDELLAEVVNVV